MDKEICTVGELKLNRPTLFTVGQKKIALMRTEHGIVAFSPVCPHARANLMHGRYDGTRVTCHWHGWSFDLQTGAGTNNEAQLVTFPVRTVGDGVVVTIEEPEPDVIEKDDMMPEIRWKNE